MKTLYFSATKGKQNSTLLHNTSPERFVFKEKNTESLAKVYNKAIDFAIQEEMDNLVLCHDDVIIESADLALRLQQLHKKYDVVGVAGASKVKIDKPVLWHIMGQNADRNCLHGAVAHGNAQQKHMTSFGVYPHQVLMIDGVFMSISKKAYQAVRFDETNPARFHFYDLAYSLDCSLNKITVGVSDIAITHSSPGLSNVTDEFTKGEDWFLEKYKQYQNKTLSV